MRIVEVLTAKNLPKRLTGIFCRSDCALPSIGEEVVLREVNGDEPLDISAFVAAVDTDERKYDVQLVIGRDE
jgi:hypothetical protein